MELLENVLDYMIVLLLLHYMPENQPLSPYITSKTIVFFSMPGVTNGTSASGLGPYTSGGTLGMIGYAQTDENCIKGKKLGILLSQN